VNIYGKKPVRRPKRLAEPNNFFYLNIMIKSKPRKKLKIRRILRIRAKVNGTSERPRICLVKSNYALSAQIVDDVKGKTMMSHRIKGKNIAAAKELGAAIAKLAQTKKIKEVVFDRRGFRYHGAVKAFADAVREGGLKI
jgi:large subunit ribosomal protein L18